MQITEAFDKFTIQLEAIGGPKEICVVPLSGQTLNGEAGFSLHRMK